MHALKRYRITIREVIGNGNISMDMLDAVQIKRHQLTAEQYHRMGEAGVFAPDARVELIEGEVIDMAPIGTRHWAAVNRLGRMLNTAVRTKAIVSVQSSFRLSRLSEPEPDIAIFKPRDDFYATALPTGADTLLVIEVSDTTLDYDVKVKAPLYARHGVADYWVFDLQAPTLCVFREPRGGVYVNVAAFEAPGIVELPGLPGISIDLTGVL